MRILLVGVAAVALSGCSWLGLGGNHHGQAYNQNSGYYGHHGVKKAHKKSCGGDQCLAKWNLEGAVGPEWIVGGKAFTVNDTNANDIGAVASSVKMKQAYEDGYRAELGGSYALTPNRKLTANGFYSKAESAGNGVLGAINGQTVTGEFSDYNSYGAEVGLRQYAAPMPAPFLRSVRPYVEGKVGAAYVEGIDINNYRVNGQALASGSDVAFYDNSWVPTAAGMVGVETPVFKQMTLGLESGIRYTGKPDSDNTVFGPGNASAGLNNGGDRWTIPVMLRGRYRF